MAPDTEKQLLQQVSEIHGYIFGVQGRPGAMENIENTLEDHGNRIGALESWRWYLVGMGAMALVIIGLVFGRH